MKRFLIFLLLLIPAIAFAGSVDGVISPASVDGVSNPTSVDGTVSTTNFIKDPNCKGAWAMSSDANETDLSGVGTTLTETGGEIPTGSDGPTDYTTTSRLFADADTEWLDWDETGNDGAGPDISGADQSMTIAFWFDDTAEYTADAYYVAKWSASAGNRQYYVKYDDSDAAIAASISNDGTAYSKAYGVTDTNDQGWHHVAVVYNDTDIRVYVDGSLDSNGAANPIAHTTGIFNGDATADFHVGFGTTIYCDAYISQLIILDRALSAAEVLEIYTYGLTGNETQ